MDLLLRALARVDRPFSLDILGEGNARASLEALAASLGLDGRVNFRGWVKHEALDGYYSAARALVVPSRWAEPFGMIGVEAMQRAKPVVAFNVGGIPDWCEHEATGLLAPEGDVEAMGRAIRRLLDDPGLATRLGAAGRARVDERFSFAAYLDALEVELGGARGVGGDKGGGE